MIERVRVILLLSSLNGGGAERVAVHLLNRCDPSRIDLRMGLLSRAGAFYSEADPARVDVATLGGSLLEFEGHNSSFYHPHRLIAGADLAPVNMARMIRGHRAHVVMSFLKGVSVLTWAALLGFGEDRPRWIVREGNNTDAVIEDELANPAGRWFVKRLTRHCYRTADCFLANSHEMAHGLERRLALDHSRMRVIQNPIDVDKVARLSREALPIAQDRPFIVTAGRLEYQKGHDLLLKAFAASEAARDLDLVILGSGTLEEELKRQAAQLGVADRVKFLGFSANPWAWLSKARLFVLPSRWEGFPSIVAEALACGAPALVTACDFGPAEVVEHGRSGWVVPPEDATAFGAAMDHLLMNDELRATFSANGRERAELFDIDRMVEAYTELFIEQAALAHAPARRPVVAQPIQVEA